MQRKERKEPSPRRESNLDAEEDPDKDTTSRFGNRSDSLRERLGNRSTQALRRRRIQRIKEDIRSGVYESEKKLAVAIDRLIEDALRTSRR